MALGGPDSQRDLIQLRAPALSAAEGPLASGDRGSHRFRQAANSIPMVSIGPLKRPRGLDRVCIVANSDITAISE